MTQNRTILYFLVSWICGILFGSLFAAGADPSLFSVMRLAFNSRVSIVSLLLSAVLPFLITAFAVFINRYAILFGISFLKGFAFSLCAAVIFSSFGTAGWLVQPMLQFSDTVLSGVFCFFCIRRCCPKVYDLKKDLTVCLIISAAVVIVDFLLVSRFLGTLM